jgi:colanic acid biosynthesis glycosyl transferase WcaI
LKILIIALNFSPELTGAGKYTGELAEFLAQSHDVTVITTPPYYPTWEIDKSYRKLKIFHEKKGRLHIIRCPLWLRKKMNFRQRLLHLSSFTLSSFWPMLQSFWRFKPDLVFYVAPTFMCLPSTILLARLFRCPLWVHIQDFEIDAMLGLRAQAQHPLAKAVLGVESWFLRKAQHFSSISAEMCDKLSHKIGFQKKVFCLPNWVDLEHFKPKNSVALRQAWGYSESDFIVLYSGNIGLKQGLDQLPSIIKATAQQKQIHYLIIGNGIYLEELQRQIEEQRLAQVRFAPLQPLEALPEILCMADVHLVLQKAEMSDLVLPSKLTAILAVGGQAILTAPPESHLFKLATEHPGIAHCLPPSNPEAVAHCILDLQHQGRSSVNHVARTYAEKNLGKEQVLSNLEVVLDSLRDA